MSFGSAMKRAQKLFELFGPQMGDPIAVRNLTFEISDGVLTDVKASIWRPVEYSKFEGLEHDTWACLWQLEGIADGKMRAAYGEDSYQALELALFIVEVELKSISEKNPGKLLHWGEPYGKGQQA